mmetsp:Transcript_41254/g.98652  ORF Transcript_41254/g.98652 Transcript_41254/m.98652 type:complete len:228 (-) Transcript_41254:1025-1708(-)
MLGGSRPGLRLREWQDRAQRAGRAAAAARLRAGAHGHLRHGDPAPPAAGLLPDGQQRRADPAVQVLLLLGRCVPVLAVWRGRLLGGRPPPPGRGLSRRLHRAVPADHERRCFAHVRASQNDDRGGVHPALLPGPPDHGLPVGGAGRDRQLHAAGPEVRPSRHGVPGPDGGGERRGVPGPLQLDPELQALCLLAGWGLPLAGSVRKTDFGRGLPGCVRPPFLQRASHS